MKVYVVSLRKEHWEHGEVRAIRVYHNEAQEFIATQERREPITNLYPHAEWRIEEHEMPLKPMPPVTLREAATSGRETP